MNSLARWIPHDVAEQLVAAGTTAFQLFRTSGACVERYGESVLISQRAEDETLRLGLDAWCRATGWMPTRIYRRHLVKGPQDGDVPQCIWGDSGKSASEVVRELGCSYEVDFAQSYSVGLFCDQRTNRAFLRERGCRRLLNLFSYTCAFSVVAARDGAQTVSVDVSRSALNRGKRNFVLNHMSTEGHRFVEEDVATYLRRLAKRGETFDVIVVDPPTFGRACGGRVFRFERDFAPLVEAAACVASPGGAILLSTNFSFWNTRRLRAEAEQVLPPGTSFVDVSPGPIEANTSTWALLP